MKYQTNIKYLKPVETIVRDFTQFVKKFNAGAFQYARLKSFYSCLSAHAAPPRRAAQGFGSIRSVSKMIFRERVSAVLLAKRLLLLFCSPGRAFYIGKAAWLTFRLSSPGRSRWFYFRFWLFNWSNSVLKYSRTSAKDFDIGSVDADFDFDGLVPREYEENAFEPIPMLKIKMQRKNTAESLRRLGAEKKALSLQERL